MKSLFGLLVALVGGCLLPVHCWADTLTTTIHITCSPRTDTLTIDYYEAGYNTPSEHNPKLGLYDPDVLVDHPAQTICVLDGKRFSIALSAFFQKSCTMSVPRVSIMQNRKPVLAATDFVPYCADASQPQITRIVVTGRTDKVRIDRSL